MVQEDDNILERAYSHNIRYSEKIQLRLVENNPWNIEYIKYPTPKVQQKAVQEKPYVIKEIEDANETIQFLAVHANYKTFENITAPTKAVRTYYEKISCKNATDAFECMQKNALEDEPQAEYILANYYKT